MKKRIFTLLSLVFLFTFVPFSANAKTLAYNNNISIKPMWENNYSANINLYSNGNELTVESKIKANNLSSRISGTMYLEKYTNGRWVNVTSWAFGGTGSVLLSRSYTATGGYQYRARISATVDGERVSATSNSVSL